MESCRCIKCHQTVTVAPFHHHSRFLPSYRFHIVFYFLFWVCRFNDFVNFFGIEVAVLALDLRPRISTGNVFQIDVNQFKEIS